MSDDKNLDEPEDGQNQGDDQDEPTMEEILASIRRIISDEDEDMAEPEDGAPAEQDDTAEADVEPAAESGEEADILELTEEMVSVEEEQVEEIEAESEQDAEAEDEAAAPEQELALDDEGTDSDEEDFSVISDDDEGLVSDAVTVATSGSFNQLSKLLARDYEGSEKTLEQLVQDMLRPLLKGWLDENLPILVERLVSEEIERISKTRRN